MTRIRTAVETLYIASLGVWLGALVMAGATAAVVFPTMKGLDPHLPEFAKHEGEHWMIAAGRVASAVFHITDCVAIGGAGFAIAALCAALRWSTVRLRGRAAGARTITLGAACALLAFNVGVLRPRMGVNLDEYWRAAAAGQTDAATAARAAFSADHPTASRTLAAMAVCVFISIAAAACTPVAAGGKERRE